VTDLGLSNGGISDPSIIVSSQEKGHFNLFYSMNFIFFLLFSLLSSDLVFTFSSNQVHVCPFNNEINRLIFESVFVECG